MAPSLLHPRARQEWLTRRRFLSRFVGRNDLVFDVGANIGEYSETFVELGARPVAIEPAPDLQDTLRERLPGVPIEQVAVSDSEGMTELMVGGGHVNSTVDPAYGRVLEEMGIALEKVSVPTTTLDALADKYGLPRFVKIDVEGHEAAVLRGMSFTPRALSFEFHGSLLDEAAVCVATLAEREYRFRPVVGFSFEWATGVWLDAEQARETLGALADAPHVFGDLYATL